MDSSSQLVCLCLVLCSVGFTIATPVTLSGSPTSFIHLDSPSFHSLPSLSFTRSEEFFDIGHPMAKSASTSSDPDLQDALHAGRFGIELNRLEQIDKEQHDNFIASGYKNDIFGVPQSLPPPLQHLSRRGGSVGRPADIQELKGLHLDDAVAPSSLHDFSFSIDSFPTLFHDPDSDQLQLVSSNRRSRIALPPKNSNKLAVIKRSRPVFSTRHF